MKKTILYHGDSGASEFWEDKNSHILINKLRNQPYWVLFVNYTVDSKNTIAETHINGVIEELKKKGYDCILSNDKKFALPHRNGKMQLKNNYKHSIGREGNVK